MGMVYKAHDEKLDRIVAIKVLRDSAVGDPTARTRFVQEARTASALNHPNIVTVHDIDDASGVASIAMECGLTGGRWPK
jgi:serine/threonine protein kinase